MNLNQILIVGAFILSPFGLVAQELIGAAGQSGAVGQSTIEWSIGEIVIDEGATNSNNFTQGLHQPKYVSAGVSTFSVEEESQVRVFPNPFSTDLRIESDEKYNAKLINPLGQVLREFEVGGSTLLDLKDLAASYYYIQLMDDEQQKHHEIKIIKSH